LLLESANDVPFYTFPSLGAFPELIHAVSTRHGGVSKPPFATLNLTWAVGDDPEAVEENHRRLCAALGVPREALVSPRQVHSAEVRRVGAGDRGRFIPGCDALITDEPGVPLLLRFADCVPIFLYDPRRKAIGLAHAGWRGTVAGMAQAIVRAMAEAFGSRPGDLVAALGPAIGPCCYEVGPEVVAAVEAAFGPDNGLLSPPIWSVEKASQPIEPIEPMVPLPNRFRLHRLNPSALPLTCKRLHFDLWAANECQLRAAGVECIEIAGLCTACHTDEFFSYRAENGRTGHHGALICLREPR